MNKKDIRIDMKKKADLKKRMLLISAGLTTVIILANALRITRAWDLTISSWTVPLWLSGLIVILALVLLFFQLKAYKQ